jgi:hypothetical protein
MAQAAGRRGQARVQAGRALRAMRERGQSLREIAQMAGAGGKTVRALIREAEGADGQARQRVDAAGADGAARGAVVGRWEVGGPAPPVDGVVGAGLGVPAQA